MAKSYPDTIPHPYDKDESLSRAYSMGWNHGHGFACHNVPTLGREYHLDSEGRMTADQDNIRDIHQALCFEAESNSRSFSPFEFTAHAFNNPEEFTGLKPEDCEDGAVSEDLWEAFEAGLSDAIFADLSEYDDEDYGIEVVEEDA